MLVYVTSLRAARLTSTVGIAVRILVIVSLALICTRPAAANELNVVPGSSDPSPDGSLEHPFSTVYQAIAAATAQTTAIILHEGRHELPTDVIVPPRIDLLILPAATLALGGHVTLAPHKLLLAEGTPDKPITFTWLVPGTNWGAIGLSHPESNGSVFRYCIVEHGDHGSHNAANFTGAISANDVTITVSHCILRDNVGPDGINVDGLYSLIEYSSFFRHAMDPIDFDVANGDVLHCEFYDSGNDAMDLGTSHGTIAYNYVDGCVDKGISVGEASNAFIHHNIVLNADLGIAIKDSSDPLVTHNTILHNRIGVSCYEKIFPRGGAKGTVLNSIIWDSTQADVWLDAKSTTQFHHCAIQHG
jgi:parallel beta-helix repeat protein